MRGRRLPRCSGCGLPYTVCMCDELVVVEHRVPVVVVMHPIEIQKTSNTGQLAARVLAHATVRPSSEPFDFGPSLLLFPHENARVLSPEDLRDGTLLVVPDGSWRQARRMARRIHETSGAELVRLSGMPATRYPLRRGSRTDTLSTFEAIVEALAIVEGPHMRTRLLPILDRFVERMLSLRGHPQVPMMRASTARAVVESPSGSSAASSRRMRRATR